MQERGDWRWLRLTARQTDDAQDVHEDVDNVQVEIECGKDVFLGADRILVAAAQHQLRIVHEIHGEEQGAQWGVHKANNLAGKEDCNDAKDDEHHQAGNQYTATHGKVPFGLEGEQCQAESNSRRDSHCHEHLIRLVLTRNDAQQEGLRKCEEEQKYEVERRLAAYALAAGHADHGHNEHCLKERGIPD